MAGTLTAGLQGEVVVAVTPDNTAEKFGNPGAAVFATPALVALMEQAAIRTIAGCLPPEEGTVGTRVEISHLAATPVGMNIRAQATLAEVRGKKLIFDVVAFDDKEMVGQGRHERFIIQSAAFYGKVAAKADL